jgi:hypothetical protein
MRIRRMAPLLTAAAFAMGAASDAHACPAKGQVLCTGTNMPADDVTVIFTPISGPAYGNPECPTVSDTTDLNGIFDLGFSEPGPHLCGGTYVTNLNPDRTVTCDKDHESGLDLTSTPFEVDGPHCAHLDAVSATADCGGFTLLVSGKVCGSASIAYTLNVMPPAGGSSAIPGTIQVTGDADCNFAATASGSWPPGVNPAGATFNGTATLAGANTLCFPPDETGSYACGPGGVPLSDGPVACDGKSAAIGPSSMEGAIKISNGDWVNGGYSMKSTVSGDLTIVARVTITGPCSNGGTDTLTVPLATKTYYAPSSATNWLPTGDANNVLSWQGSVRVGVTSPSICGGVGKLDASKGAVFTATFFANPPQPGAMVTFRFKYRDPAAKGKPNTNCLDTSDPNRAKADVCGASWSATKTFDP